MVVVERFHSGVRMRDDARDLRRKPWIAEESRSRCESIGKICGALATTRYTGPSAGSTLRVFRALVDFSYI